jgi:hypothetical protein
MRSANGDFYWDRNTSNCDRMPTILDFLREHLLGDELADRLEQWLAAKTAMVEAGATAMNRTGPVLAPLSAAQIGVTQPHATNPFLEAFRTPSPGYEPLLMRAGWNKFAARGVAKLAVRHGKRRAAESRLEGRVSAAIRFLAQQPRQDRAVTKRAEFLLEAYDKTSLIDSLFEQAGNEVEFIGLLKNALDGHRIDSHRLTDIAAAVAPLISVKRGPKITAQSAAHEFLFREVPKLPIKRRPGWAI